MVGLISVCLTGPVFAGGGACGYLVVYDPTDTNSTAVANYYQQIRHVPEGNMVPYVFPQLPGTNRGNVMLDDFVSYLRSVISQRGLAGHFNGLAMAGISPLVDSRGGNMNLACHLYQSPNYTNVGSMPTSGIDNWAARLNGATTELRSDLIMSGTKNSYNPGQGHYWCVSYIGWTGASGLGPQEVFNYLQRAKEADGHGQGGTIYCPYSGDDGRYGIRGGRYALGVSTNGEIALDAVPAWDALGIKYAQPNKPSLNSLGCMSQCGDVAGEIDGITVIASGNTGNTYLPGAYADHATSVAGILDHFFTSQGPCAYWIHKGAYGTSGMTTEPYAIGRKFTHPNIHTHLRNGASLAEAAWESVAFTEEILFLGDPLMQPYATFPAVSISSPAADGVMVSNALTITASAAVGALTTPTTMAPASLELNLDLALDGHVVNIGATNETIKVTRTNGGTGFVLDTTTLADGWHELRVIAYNNNPVRTQGEATRTLVVNNHGQSVMLSGPVSVDYAGGTALFTATPSVITGATNLTLQANGRTLARLPVGGGSTNLPASLFGFHGTTAVYAVSWLNNGQQVWSAPWNLAVTWTPNAPANVTLTPNRTALVKFFANTRTNSFSWATTLPTEIINWTNNLVFNTNTLAPVTPSDYTTLPGYEVNTHYWAATTDLYEFAVNDLSNSGVKSPPNPGPLTNLVLLVDGQPAGSTLGGRTLPVKLAAGAHELTYRFEVTNSSFCPAMFVRDVDESGFCASYDSAKVNSGGLYLLLPKSSLFTATNATPPTITAGPATTSSLNSNKVNLAVTAATENPGRLTYTWSKVAGPVEGGVTFSTNRTAGASNTVATFGMAGTYLLQVAINDGTAVTFGQLPVTVGNAKEVLVVSPAFAIIRTNMTASYQVAILDGFGNTAWPPVTNVAWSASAGIITATGLANSDCHATARYLAPLSTGLQTNTITATDGIATGRGLAVVMTNIPPTPLSTESPAEKRIVTIKKLAAPLPIDGDLEKWHKIGLTPQIVITPPLDGPIKGAKDCSALIRMAYHGDDIYVQVLKFDDVVMFDPSVGTHLQDSLEMLINGFQKPGFQFVVGKFGPGGTDAVKRERFGGGPPSLLSPDVIPRVLKVLDNALAVPERKMIEAATGEDLSQAKVIVMEFKLPITATGAFTGEGAADVFPIQPGKGFWLGFNVNDNDMPTLNDNDTPGTGMGVAQKWISWPAGFGLFGPRTNNVWAVFE